MSLRARIRALGLGQRVVLIGRIAGVLNLASLWLWGGPNITGSTTFVVAFWMWVVFSIATTAIPLRDSSSSLCMVLVMSALAALTCFVIPRVILNMPPLALALLGGAMIGRWLGG